MGATSPGAANTVSTGGSGRAANARSNFLDDPARGRESSCGCTTHMVLGRNQTGTRPGQGADAPCVKIERHTWINTIVGVLDTAFSLSEEELYLTTVIVRRLLEGLRIPERGEPHTIPAAVAQEALAGVFSTLLNSPRGVGLVREPRPIEEGDTVVTLEAWRQAVLGLITSAYPDLQPLEIVWATTTIDELLLGLGIPARAAAFFPDEVVRAHNTGA